MYRTRNRGGTLTPVPGARVDRINTNCSETSWTYNSTDSAGPGVGELEYMTDVVVPGFHARSARGEVFFNPMSHVRESYVSGGGNGHAIRQASPITCSGASRFPEWRRVGDSFPCIAAKMAGLPSVGATVPPFSILSNDEVTRCATEASTQALANVGTARANLYEDLAQLDQTLGRYNYKADQLHKIIRNIPMQRLSQRVNKISSAYLLARYGVKPLVGDISDIVNSAAKSQVKRETARGWSSITRSDVRTSIVPYDVVQVTVSAQSTDSLQARAMVLTERAAPALNEAGLSFKQLITLPWELVPYSFVIDSFANFGDYLNAIVQTPDVTQLGSALTMIRSRTTTYLPVGTSANSGYVLTSAVTGSFQSTVIRRDRGALATPGVVWRSDFRLNNLQRAVDLTALIVQRLTMGR